MASTNNNDKGIDVGLTNSSMYADQCGSADVHKTREGPISVSSCSEH